MENRHTGLDPKVVRRLNDEIRYLRSRLKQIGYEGDNAEVIGVVAPNPAIIRNRCHTVLVRNAVQVGEPHLEGFEDIHTRLVGLADIPDLIRDGVITHSLVIAAFHYLQLSDET